MLWLIEDRLKRNDCDDVMEIAWSTMWNVTDETPANCENFLDGKGMSLFLGCLSAFPNRPELLRNMMGMEVLNLVFAKIIKYEYMFYYNFFCRFVG